MIDPPTPAGFVADAEETLAKARAMSDQAQADYLLWSARRLRAEIYLARIRAWAAAGGTGPRPAKPQEPTPE